MTYYNMSHYVKRKKKENSFLLCTPFNFAYIHVFIFTALVLTIEML